MDFAYSTGAGLQDVSLQVNAGESVVLVGPSGAGRPPSRMALRLLRPARGTARLLGRDLSALSGSVLRTHLRQAHLIFQDPFSALPWLERLDTLRREHGLAVLLITHNRVQANAFCDRIVTMDHGRLTADVASR